MPADFRGPDILPDMTSPWSASRSCPAPERLVEELRRCLRAAGV